MPFKYTAVNDTIVFTRAGTGCARAAAIVFGSFFAIIGFGLFAFESESSIFFMFRFMFAALGSTFVLVGITLPKLMGKAYPDKIIFDNTNGRIEVSQEASEVKTAYMYYDEIEDFVVRVRSEDNNSKAYGRSYSYFVFLVKKDGGEWELVKRRERAHAEEDAARLKQLVKFDAKPVKVPVSVEPSKKYTITKGALKTEVSWRNTLGMQEIRLAIFAAFFIITAAGIFSVVNSLSDFPVFFMIIAGFIGTLFVVIIGYYSRKALRNLKTAYAISISSMTFEYIERDKHGRELKSERIPLASLHAIAFSFNTEKTMRKVFVYTHDQFQRKNKLSNDISIEAFKSHFSFYNSLLRFELKNLTPVETLYLENFLQDAIRERSGVDVA